MSIYTIEEKIQMVKWYYAGNTADEIIDEFASAFKSRPIPHRSTVLRIINKFGTTGCLTNCTKCAHLNLPVARKVSEAQLQKVARVCALAESNSLWSSRQIGEVAGLNERTVRDILRRNQFKCYKVRSSQKIFAENKNNA